MNKKLTDILEELMEIDLRLSIVLDDLYQLEIMENKNTGLYKNKILEYKDIILKEQSIYNKLNVFDAEILANYILENMIKVSFNTNLESIMTQKYQNIIIRRILANLSKRLANNSKMLETMFPELMYENYSAKQLKEIYQIRNCINLDVLNALLTFIEEYNLDGKYAFFFNKIKKIKYDISFIMLDLEKKLLDDDFNIYDNFSFSNQNVNLEQLKSIKQEYAKEMIKTQIDRLLEISDLDYNQNDILFSSLIRSCYIRAGLLLLSNEEREKIRLYFEKRVKFNISVEKSIYLIRESFDKIKEDQEKIILKRR